MSILFGLLLARRFYCRTALSLSPGRTGGLLPRINAPKARSRHIKRQLLFVKASQSCMLYSPHNNSYGQYPSYRPHGY